MAINRTFAAAQIRRFRSYAGFDGSKEGTDELIHAYEETCDTDERVKEVTDYLIRTVKDFAPKPAHIYEANELLAQQQYIRDSPPSVYATPGEFYSNLADDMPEGEYGKWKALAQTAKDPAMRAVAAGIAAHWENDRAVEKRGRR